MIKDQLKNYKNIIWDWNGTLLNDVQLCADIMNGLLSSRSLPTITLDRYREIFTFPVKDYYIEAGHDFSTESFEKIGEEFIINYETKKLGCELYPFAIKVLQHLHSSGRNQYLLSAYKQENLLRIVEHYNISKYFNLIRGLGHIYADGKMELGVQLMKDIPLNGDNHSAILIGDTVHDYEVARELGIECLLISNGHQNEGRLIGFDIPVIKNMEELFFLLN